MALAEFDLADGSGKVLIDAKRVDFVRRSAKDAAGKPITMIYVPGRVTPVKVQRSYANTRTDLTTAGWGT